MQTITVVGAGNMGSGIAQAFAQNGFTVRLHDINEEAIQRGLDRIRSGLEKRVTAGRMDQAVLDATMAHLHACPALEDAVAEADLVIEAVFEDLKVKQETFRSLDAACGPETVLATNTSSLQVRDLAAVTERPDKVLGLHFFFPAHVNRLVEVVKGPETDEGVFRSVYNAATRAGKIPIKTADVSGFCVNRFFVPWINEACRILEEGAADIPTIEAAAKQEFGIGMGPFELMNATGIPISLHAQTTLHKAFGAFYEPAAILGRKVEEGTLWDLSGEADKNAFGSVAARLRGVVFGIACHLVDDGVASMRDTDRGATIGLRWKRGPFAMMNALGLERAYNDVRRIHEAWGDAFSEPATLGRLAGAGEAWHLPAVTLEWRADGQVAEVTFDRPEALNALDPKVLDDLDDVLGEIEGKGTARCIVVTGSGKAFIAGADIPTMAAMDPAGAQAYTEQGNRVIDRIASMPCPVIMAINGVAFGGGLELALAGDLLLASDRAVLGLPEVGLGIHPGFGGTQRLPRRVGLGVAKDLVLTGRTVDADEALRIGLVNRVVPHQELLDRARALAKEIAGKAPLAVAGAKRSMDAGFGTDLAQGLRIEQESVVLLFATRDKEEGLRAFLERRRPEFTGA